MHKFLPAFLITLLASVSLRTLHAQTPQPATWQPAAPLKQIPIWQAAAPDLQPAPGPETLKDGCIENVTVPTMTVYPPKGKNTGVAVVVFPGGGYQILAIELEGVEICKWLSSRGITAVLLKYRVPFSGPHYDKKLNRHVEPVAPTALEDAQRTLGLVHQHAAGWKIDPHKIGVIGFSAGGHLVADIGTHFGKRAYPPVDAADKESCRPDFGMAIYPGHMLENTNSDFELNPKVPVTKETPPMFIVQAENDPVDEVQNSLVLYMALKNARVPVEMHLYAEGGHAFGLRPTKLPITQWPALAEKWLRTIGMISDASSVKD